jgi:hypothetical protein
MDYQPKNSFSMSYASRKVIFPGVVMDYCNIPACLEAINEVIALLQHFQTLFSYNISKLTPPVAFTLVL